MTRSDIAAFLVAQLRDISYEQAAPAISNQGQEAAGQVSLTVDAEERSDLPLSVRHERHHGSVNESSKRRPREGDEMWLGLIGPIRVSDADSPERTAWAAAGRVAQAAHSWDDLASLVRSHSDHRVRYQAIPRLRARFPDDSGTLEVLVEASVDRDSAVRDAAIFALGDLGGSTAADAIAARLGDDVFEVRLSAAQTLGHLGDERAPDDPEVWALGTMLPAEE
jgi:hypothetical protein